MSTRNVTTLSAAKLTINKYTPKDVVVGAMLDLVPEQILVQTENNARFNGPANLAPLVADVRLRGFISNVEAYALTPELMKQHPGKLVCLTLGFNRAAVLEFLRKEGIDIKLPTRIVEFKSKVDTLERNIAENWKRHAMTTMDIARAIKQLLAEGRTEKKIREQFAPVGKKEMSPVRFTQYNRLNDLAAEPGGRELQQAIHDGDILSENALSATGIRDMPKQIKYLQKLLAVKDEREAKAEKALQEYDAKEKETRNAASLRGEKPPAPAPAPGFTESGRRSRAESGKAATVAEANDILRDSGIAAELGKDVPRTIKQIREDMKALSTPKGTRLASCAIAMEKYVAGKISLDNLKSDWLEALLEGGDDEPAETKSKAKAKAKVDGKVPPAAKGGGAQAHA